MQRQIFTQAKTGRRYTLRAVTHPTGGFMRPDGTRYRLERQWIDLTNGDLVRHGDSGQEGVIVNESYSPTQVEVAVAPQTVTIRHDNGEIVREVPGHIAVWYVSRLTVA